MWTDCASLLTERALIVTEFLSQDVNRIESIIKCAESFCTAGLFYCRDSTYGSASKEYLGHSCSCLIATWFPILSDLRPIYCAYLKTLKCCMRIPTEGHNPSRLGLGCQKHNRRLRCDAAGLWRVWEFDTRELHLHTES